jgi:pimeloyl-ACP methyl ester carboxylesterase
MGGLLGRAANWSRNVWPLATASAMSLYWAPKYLGSEAVERTTNDLRRITWDSAVGSLRTMVGQDYSSHLERVAQPTLLICGRKDFTIPPADSHIASQRLPNARLMVLDGVHHQPTDEEPRTVIQAVKEFLSNGADTAG